MTAQSSKRGRKPHKSYEQSDYSKFHFAFLGYRFLDKATQRVKTKLQVFLINKKEALCMAELRRPTDKYDLVDSPGWENGTEKLIQ